MKKYIITLVLLVFLCLGSAYAADLNETLSEDTKQWLRNNTDKWWAKEVVLFLDQSQDILDLNFGNFITDTVDYYKHYQDYVDYKLNGNLPPLPSISPIKLTYSSFQGSGVNNSDIILAGVDNTGNNTRYFSSNSKYGYDNKGVRINGQNNSGYIDYLGVSNFTDFGGVFSIKFTNKFSTTYNNQSYNFAYSKSPTAYINYDFAFDCTETFTANIKSYTDNGCNFDWLYSNQPVNGNTFIKGKHYYCSIQWYGTSVKNLLPCAFNENIIIPLFEFSVAPPPPERPIFNNTYSPNINNYIDTNMNWNNDFSEIQYNTIQNIYNDITNNVYENEKFITEVLDKTPTSNDLTIQDKSDLFNYPGEFLSKLRNVLINGYSSNFKFHLNKVLFKGHVIIPELDFELNPRDILGSFWDIFTYIIAFMLTLPWIMWFIKKFRGESDF